MPCYSFSFLLSCYVRAMFMKSMTWQFGFHFFTDAYTHTCPDPTTLIKNSHTCMPPIHEYGHYFLGANEKKEKRRKTWWKNRRRTSWSLFEVVERKNLIPSYVNCQGCLCPYGLVDNPECWTCCICLLVSRL